MALLGLGYSDTPNHVHDCSDCAFLGALELVLGKWIDFYVCSHGLGRTYIGRFGGNGWDYTSMTATVLSDMDSIPADPILVVLWLLWAADDAKMRMAL